MGPLISDLDGTIADTAPAIFHSLRVTCSELGLRLTKDDELSWSLGPPLHWCLERLGVPSELMGDAVVIFERAHTESLDLVRSMPGADAVLGELARDGVRIGVATIKPQGIAELVLDVIGLREYISCVHGRTHDFDPQTKTDLVRSALDELDGSSPLYVGDHDNDEAAAAALGIPFLRYPQHSWTAIRDVLYG